MTKAAIATDVHKALDVQGHLGPEASFNLVLLLNGVTQQRQILVGEGIDIGIGIDLRFSQISTAENLPIP